MEGIFPCGLPCAGVCLKTEGRGYAMEEYMRILLEQIHCVQARELVGEEIRNHIMDQAQANERAGMDREQALADAVRDMGDPVETGAALDRIHRPSTDWRLLVLVGLLSLCSILVHIGVGSRQEMPDGGYGWKHGVRVLMGYGIMLAVYRLDYGRLGKYAKRIAAGCFFAALAVSVMGNGLNGAERWVSFGILGKISFSDLFYLYIPVYGALLYRYKGEGYRGVGKCILWMSFPVLTLRANCLSAAVLLSLVLMAMFSVAVGKGWFAVPKRKTLAAFWTAFGLLPMLAVALAVRGNYLALYQTERLRAFLGKESSYLDYQRQMIMEYAKSIRFIGSSGREFTDLSGINNDHLLNFVANDYGMAVLLLIGILLFAVAARIIHVSCGQGNPLGMMIGCGCGLFFEMVTAVDILHFFGRIPSMRLFLPFFSPEGEGILVAYLLAGVVLSVYRYRNIKGCGRPA